MLFFLCPDSYSSCLLMRPAHLTPEKPCPNVSGPVSPQAVAHLFRPEFPYIASSLNYLFFKRCNLCFPFPYLSPAQRRVLLHLPETDTRIKRNKNGQQKTFDGLRWWALCSLPLSWLPIRSLSVSSKSAPGSHSMSLSNISLSAPQVFPEVPTSCKILTSVPRSMPGFWRIDLCLQDLRISMRRLDN